MRKHFLILMLLTLLPLAGRAATAVTFPVDLSDGWSIKFGAANQAFSYYTGGDVMPAVSLVKDGYDPIEYNPADPKFNVVWKNSSDEVVETITTVGEYFVTVTKDASNTFDDLATPTRKFTVLIANNEPTTAPAIITPEAPATYLDWQAAGHQLLKTPAVLTFGTALYKVTTDATVPTATSEGWYAAASLPKVTDAGTFYLYYRADADANGNYKAINPTAVGHVTINGVSIPTTGFTAPTVLADNTIDFDNASHALVNQGECGSTYGTLYYSYKVGSGEYSEWSTTVPSAKDAGTYSIKWKVEGKGQYNGQESTADIEATISPVASEITFAAANGATGLKYDATEQPLLASAATATLGATPTYKVQYNATDLDDWSGVTATAKATSDLVKGKNAGFYRIEALVADDGNYTGTTSKFITVQIEKRTLYVTTKAETKAYGAPDPTFTIAEYRGFQGNDWYENDGTKVKAAGFVAPTVTREIPASGKAHQNVGTYKISASAGAADNYVFDFTEATGKSVFNNLTITKKALNTTDFNFELVNTAQVYDGTAKTPDINTHAYVKYDGTNAVDVANLATDDAILDSPADYAYTYQNNVNAGDDAGQVIITGQNNFEGSIVLTFDIAKAGIYVLPLTAEKNYGANDPNEVATLCAGTAEPDPTVYQYKLVNNSNVEVAGASLNGVVKLQREAGEAVSTYKIYFKSYTPDANVADNYEVLNSAVLATETTAGRIALFNLKQASDGLKLKFKSTAVATKVYGDATPTWTIADLEPVDENPGFVAGDTWETVMPTLSAPVFTLASENVENAEQNKVTVTNLASTNYPSVTVEPLTFNVTARPIAVVTVDQAFDYGQALEQGVAKWDVVDANSYDSHALVTWFPAPATADTKEDLGLTLFTDDEIATYGPGQHPAAIKARITNKNYSLNDKCAWGKLTITGTALVLNDNNANVYDVIKANHNQTTNVSIIFHRDQHLKSDGDGVDRTWMKEKWNSIVLPFDIEISELSSKFGYAIFNVADPDNTVSTPKAKVAFKIEMAANYDGNKIPANTPLLIKTNKAIADGTTVNFGSKKIIAPDAAQFGYTINATGYKFMGTYAPMTVNAESQYADNIYFWTGTTDLPARIQSTSTKGNEWIIKPFSAYVDQSAASTAHDVELEFTYEDLNGQTTTVKGISIDDINSDKLNEGVYNLNGVKMNNVPTQKGIYIMNGKKVVVK